jgi:hypothetical protein
VNGVAVPPRLGLDRLGPAAGAQTIPEQPQRPTPTSPPTPAPLPGPANPIPIGRQAGEPGSSPATPEAPQPQAPRAAQAAQAEVHQLPGLQNGLAIPAQPLDL